MYNFQTGEKVLVLENVEETVASRKSPKIDACKKILYLGERINCSSFFATRKRKTLTMEKLAFFLIFAGTCFE